jgi:hypothetical protein
MMIPGIFCLRHWHKYFSGPSRIEIQRLIDGNIDGFRDKVVHYGRYDKHPYIEVLSYISWLDENNYCPSKGGAWPS